MNFEKHLFISYAHLDNKTLTPEQEGWITRFHKALEVILGFQYGVEAQIWRDQKLQGNDDFSQEIFAQFPKTAILVSIVTPRYAKSEWCNEEVNAFIESTEQTGGICVGNKTRVFKVIKTPVGSEEKLPSVLQETLGYEFFIEKDGAPIELNLDDSRQVYTEKVTKLACDIKNLLKQIESDEEAIAPKPTVYLAECSYDRKQDREKLESELKGTGYDILPDRPLPRDEEDYVSAAREQIGRAALSIHLIGELYGAVPDGPSAKSVSMIQNELAAAHSGSRDFPRIISLPDGTLSDQPEQQQFIDVLHQDAEAQHGADLITGDLEELKRAIHNNLEKLEKPEKPEKPEPQADPSPLPELGAAAPEVEKLIYLICNEKDRKATVPLRKYLREEGFEVSLPVFEGDAGAVSEAHRQQLANCDAVLVFYGAGEEAWKRAIDGDLKKMPGYRAGKPLLANWTYLAAPMTPDKEDLIDMEEPHLPHLIDGLGEFSEATLGAFLGILNGEGATA